MQNLSDGVGGMQPGIPTGLMAPGIPQQQQIPPIMGNPDGAQQFCLRWNSYPATVATQLAALRAAEDFVDVTLACDGRQLRAHKLVLSACSPYFMQLFKSTPCQHPVIFLRDVGFRQLVALLEFMYAGEVNVSQVELPALLRTAEALQVRGLADTTTNNNNNNNNMNSSIPQPKPAFSPSYGQNVGAPNVMNHTPPAQTLPDQNSLPNNCSEASSNMSASTTVPLQTDSSASTPKQNRRDERNVNLNSDGKRDGEDEENSSDSNESHEDFEMIDQEMKPYMPDGSVPEQIEDPVGVFDGDGGEGDVGDGGGVDDSDPLNINQDVGSASIGESQSQSEEETSEEEDDGDEEDGDCKQFTYQSDASYSQETMPEPGGSTNGESVSGPSGISLADGEGSVNNCKDDSGSGGGGSGRNRLSRSLWPPGIPYHGPQQCPYCPRILSNVGNWRKHVLTMHFAREKNHKCRHCASAFRTAEYLQKHYVRVHNYPQKLSRRNNKYVEQT